MSIDVHSSLYNYMVNNYGHLASPDIVLGQLISYAVNNFAEPIYSTFKTRQKRQLHPPLHHLPLTIKPHNFASTLISFNRAGTSIWVTRFLFCGDLLVIAVSCPPCVRVARKVLRRLDWRVWEGSRGLRW
jgi:hypothetical protein